MRRVQWSGVSIGVIACVAASLGVLPAAALAGRAPRPVLGPAAPTLKTPITVTWNVKASRKGFRYLAQLTSRANLFGSLDCVDGAEVMLRKTRQGFAGTLRPNRSYSGSPTWCPGSMLVKIIRVGPAKIRSGPIAGARVTVVLGRGETQPKERQGPGGPTRGELLQGSTITASAPGRPDRSSPVTGILRGEIPGRFKPNTDVEPILTTGGITPTALAPDPLCPDTPAPSTFGIGAPSTMTLFANGNARLDLVLSGGASQLFGCGPAGPLAGTTTLQLTGRVTPLGLLKLPLNGVVSGIPLPGGSSGGLAANLLVNVDLSGRS